MTWYMRMRATAGKDTGLPRSEEADSLALLSRLDWLSPHDVIICGDSSSLDLVRSILAKVLHHLWRYRLLRR